MKAKRITLAVLVLAMIAAIAVVLLYALWRGITRSETGMIMLEVCAPGLIPMSTLRENLQSGDPDLTRETLGILAGRKDPAALDLAIPLLASPGNYVWLNAALYAGACGQEDAVPFLIKALRHTAWTADPEIVKYLQAITGQSFGADFSKWQGWWLERHPGDTFDWESRLGFSPRTAGGAPPSPGTQHGRTTPPAQVR